MSQPEKQAQNTAVAPFNPLISHPVISDDAPRRLECTAAGLLRARYVVSPGSLRPSPYLCARRG